MKTHYFDEKIATNVETKEVRLHALSRDNHIISPVVPSLRRVTAAPSNPRRRAGGAHRAQCVLPIIRISWNYTESLGL